MNRNLKTFFQDKARANHERLQAGKVSTESTNPDLVCNRVLAARDLAEQYELNPLLVICPMAFLCNWEQHEPCIYHEEFIAENEQGTVDWPRTA